MNDTFSGMCVTLRRSAEFDFAKHVLTERGPGEWHCAAPGTGIGSFNIIVRPGVVLIWGDIGEGVYRGGEAGDMLGWLRGAVRSPDYLTEKLRTKKREFYPGDALAYARERAAEEGESAKWREVLADAERLHRLRGLNERTWPDLVYHHTGDVDAVSVGFNYDARSRWLYEALWWFITAHDQRDVSKGTPDL